MCSFQWALTVPGFRMYHLNGSFSVHWVLSYFLLFFYQSYVIILRNISNPGLSRLTLFICKVSLFQISSHCEIQRGRLICKLTYHSKPVSSQNFTSILFNWKTNLSCFNISFIWKHYTSLITCKSKSLMKIVSNKEVPNFMNEKIQTSTSSHHFAIFSGGQQAAGSGDWQAGVGE